MALVFILGGVLGLGVIAVAVTSRVSFVEEKANLPNCSYQQWGFGCQ
jgi:hypothetical protein